VDVVIGDEARSGKTTGRSTTPDLSHVASCPEALDIADMRRRHDELGE